MKTICRFSDTDEETVINDAPVFLKGEVVLFTRDNEADEPVPYVIVGKVYNMLDKTMIYYLEPKS